MAEVVNAPDTYTGILPPSAFRRIDVPKDVRVLVPEVYDYVTLRRKRDLTDVIN